MKQQKSSATAEGMAVVRAIESAKAADIRLYYDPVAKKLANPLKVFLSRATINSGLYEKIGPVGTIEFITARERYIDDFTRACLAEGFTQVVILGAGFDTRACRMDGMAAVKVFEVDHPATQAAKLKKLRKALGTLPGNVVYVPVDFNTQSLAERLAAAGYCESGKTLFIAQGVVMYLTEAGVDATLAFIAEHSAAGSAVVFDYFYNETLADMKMDATHKIAHKLGEDIIFGIDMGKTAEFLQTRGFADIQNAEAKDLERLYFTGKNAGRVVAKGAAIASGRVRGK